MRPRKDHEPVVLAPASPLDRQAERVMDRGWFRRQRRADREEARKISALRAGFHPLICIGQSLDPLAVEAAAAMAGEEPLKQGDRSFVVRTERVAGLPSLGPVVLKHYFPGRGWDPRDACAKSKAVRSLLAARALQRRGFMVAEPLAAWSRPGQGSWLLMRDLTQLEPLHRAVSRLAEPERRELLAEFAACLRQLHNAGVAYRDLKPSNVMVAAGWDDRFAFIDHDRNRFLVKPVPHRLAGRDIAAVHAGLPPLVRASERCAALALYDPGMMQRGRWQREVRPILIEASRRRHRWIARRLLGGA